MGRVFRSRDKLMLRPKNARQLAFPDRFAKMLKSGCEAYGTFQDGMLQAFCIFSPWHDMPVSTLVLMQSRPLPGPVDFAKNGLSACLDAALSSLEKRGYSHTVFRRILDAKWRPDRILRNAGRLGEYSFTVAEVVRAGAKSRWAFLSDTLLDGGPVEHDSAIVIGGRPDPS